MLKQTFGGSGEDRAYHRIVEDGRDVDDIGLIRWAKGARFHKIHGKRQDVKVLVTTSSLPFMRYGPIAKGYKKGG